MMWEHYHYRFGLAGECQADIIQSYLEQRRGLVLNIGCGPWPDKVRNLAQLCDWLIVADKSPECMGIVKRGMAEPNVSLFVADAHSLPLADASVTHVVALGLFAYISDIFGVLSELRRVCRPNGHVMITNSVAHDPEPYRIAAERAGLDLVKQAEGYCPAASGNVKRRYLHVYVAVKGQRAA